jgi:hypothetical protein
MDEEHIGTDEDDDEVRANARSVKRTASFGERDEEDVQEKSASGSSKEAQPKAKTALGTID